MSIMDKIKADALAAVAWVEHAAAYLVGATATAETSLHQLEAEHPVVAEAIAAGQAAAIAHGVPVAAIEAAGEAVLDVAKEVAAQMQAPVVAPPAAPASAAPAPPAA